MCHRKAPVFDKNAGSYLVWDILVNMMNVSLFGVPEQPPDRSSGLVELGRTWTVALYREI